MRMRASRRPPMWVYSPCENLCSGGPSGHLRARRFWERPHGDAGQELTYRPFIQQYFQCTGWPGEPVPWFNTPAGGRGSLCLGSNSTSIVLPMHRLAAGGACALVQTVLPMHRLAARGRESLCLGAQDGRPSPAFTWLLEYVPRAAAAATRSHPFPISSAAQRWSI